MRFINMYLEINFGFAYSLTCILSSHPIVKKIFTDKNNQEKVVQESGLDWCIVRPGGLTVDPPSGVINVIDGEAGSITRADVASFCLDAVKTADFPYIGKTPCISSVGGTSWVKDRSGKARGMEE